MIYEKKNKPKEILPEHRFSIDPSSFPELVENNCMDFPLAIATISPDGLRAISEAVLVAL